MRGFGIVGCGCCSESCGHSRELRTFRRLWRRGRGHVPGAKARTLGWVGMPRLKPGPISGARAKTKAEATATAKANAGILRCAQNDNSIQRAQNDKQGGGEYGDSAFVRMTPIKN